MSVYDYPHSEYEHNHVVSMLIHEMRTLKNHLEALDEREAQHYTALTNSIDALSKKEGQDIANVNQRITDLSNAHNNDVTAINQRITDLTNRHNTDIAAVNKDIADLALKEGNDVATLQELIAQERSDRVTAINELTEHMHIDIDNYASYDAPTTALLLNRRDKTTNIKED